MMKQRIHYVYELCDSKGAAFYVGKGIGRRMYLHRRDASAGAQTGPATKIRELWDNGVDFTEKIIAEFFNSSDASMREKEEIAKRTNLVNKKAGGAGTHYDARPSDENKDGHSREWSALLGVPVKKARISQYI